MKRRADIISKSNINRVRWIGIILYDIYNIKCTCEVDDDGSIIRDGSYNAFENVRQIINHHISTTSRDVP